MFVACNCLRSLLNSDLYGALLPIERLFHSFCISKCNGFVGIEDMTVCSFNSSKRRRFLSRLRRNLAKQSKLAKIGHLVREKQKSRDRQGDNR